MDDKTHKRTLEGVDALIGKLKDTLGLHHVKLTVNYHRDRLDPSDDGTCTTARIAPSWEYAYANLDVCLPCMADRSDDERAETILHELVHYWIHPISPYDGKCDELKKLEERVATDIARAFRLAMEAAADEVADHYRPEIKRLERELKKLAQPAA